MIKPKFEAGQIVEFSSRSHSRRGGTYEIVRVLPPEDGVHRYRVRSFQESHERTAAEHELRLGIGLKAGGEREQAMDEFAARWRLWLEWAGLREALPEERVRLP